MRSELRAEIADLKSSLLMWLVPTTIGSITGAVGLAVALTRGG
jgi:high-affinity K+ transport system ATPase subunit B